MGCYFCGQAGKAAHVPNPSSFMKSRPLFLMKFPLYQDTFAQSQATAN